jgi:hypothetical protein
MHEFAWGRNTITPEFNLGRRKTLIRADKKAKISVFCVHQRPEKSL